MRPRDKDLARSLETKLLSFDRNRRPLHGIIEDANRETLIEQLLESIHRVKYVSVILGRNISDRRADPNDDLFDPLKAAVLHKRSGHMDEAFWMVFLFVHFGKHTRAGWRYAREIYGRLGGPGLWDWESTSTAPADFRAWLDRNQSYLKRQGLPRGFGNHRKYQSLDAYSGNGTGAAVESYIRWVNPPRTHRELMNQAIQQANGDSRIAFDELYRSLDVVTSFGRTARFDYLTMVGKLELAPIEPGFTYMKSATGPVAGARLLFSGHKAAPINPSLLEVWLVELEAELKVGMQVIEDALCNWQKSPEKFKAFRG